MQPKNDRRGDSSGDKNVSVDCGAKIMGGTSYQAVSSDAILWFYRETTDLTFCYELGGVLL